jgi:hypothetical protein
MVAISVPLTEALEKIDDECRDLGAGVLLQKMTAGDEMRPLRLGQKLLKAAAESLLVEDIVLASPNDRGG